MRCLIFIYSFSLLFFTGCQTIEPVSVGVPTVTQIKQAESRSGHISPEVAKAKIVDYGFSIWKNPEGVKYMSATPLGFGWAMFRRGAVSYGHIFSININAQNGYGAYTGYDEYLYLVTDNSARPISSIEWSKYGDMTHIYMFGTKDFFYMPSGAIFIGGMFNQMHATKLPAIN